MIAEKTAGPYKVSIYCFEGDAIVGHPSDFTEQDNLADGTTGTFTVNLHGSSCASYVAEVSGYYNW